MGTLYGAYRLAEHLGVRFYLHGDVVPDEQIAAGIADAGRDAQAAVRPARHSAVPRFSRGARLVEPRRLQGDPRPVAEDGDELLRAAHVSRGRRRAGAAGVDRPARRDRPRRQGEGQLSVAALHGQQRHRRVGIPAGQDGRLRLRRRRAVRPRRLRRRLHARHLSLEQDVARAVQRPVRPDGRVARRRVHLRPSRGHQDVHRHGNAADDSRRR